MTALLAGTSASQAQLSVSPIILEIAPKVATEARSISVTNTGAEPIEVRFYAGDFDQNEMGEHRFAEAGSLPNSCAERLRVYPDGASILPGETQSVQVQMAPGTDVCWSAVFVEAGGVRVNGAVVRQRVAAKVYGVPADARREGEVVKVATRVGPDGRTLSLTFRNLGEAPLRPHGTMEIRSFTGDLVAESKIDGFSVLPGRDRTLELPVSGTSHAGEYVAVPVLDFGGAYLTGGQMAFEVRPGEALYASESPANAGADGALQ